FVMAKVNARQHRVLLQRFCHCADVLSWRSTIVGNAGGEHRLPTSYVAKQLFGGPRTRPANLENGSMTRAGRLGCWCPRAQLKVVAGPFPDYRRRGGLLAAGATGGGRTHHCS